ncbi:MAG: hypothetical protein ACXWVD_00255 [Telluria sp.]
MTVIAWDGSTLAADRESGDSYVKCFASPKIARIRNHLVGCTGPAAQAREMLAWFAHGAKPADFPPTLRSEKSLSMLAITPQGKILLYQDTPYPIDYIGDKYAIGSGREAAMAVMLAGHDARRAVEIASLVCTGCGNGTDTLEF